MNKYIGFIIGLGIFCLILVVVSFNMMGSPNQQKKINFDRQRIADFNSLKYHIEDHYRVNGSLPISLEKLSKIPMLTLLDPETKQPYTYMKDSPTFYSLCTQFSTDSSESSNISSDYYSNPPITFKKGYSCISYNIEAVITPTFTPFPTYPVYMSPTPTATPTPTYITPPVVY